ncbi:MAG: hypothetical protein AAF437_04040 [Pseudomonadota bacterium]
MIVVSMHEDDEGMRNLYAASAADAVFSGMDKAIAASEKNRSASGLGWDAMHVIEHPKPTFADEGLQTTQLVSAMEGVIPRVSRFTIGGTPNNPIYSEDEKPVAFGYGDELYIKAEVSSDLVSHIWYDVQTTEATKLQGLRQAFEALDKVIPCVLADYWVHADGFLSNREFLDDYFAFLANLENH